MNDADPAILNAADWEVITIGCGSHVIAGPSKGDGSRLVVAELQRHKSMAERIATLHNMLIARVRELEAENARLKRELGPLLPEHGSLADYAGGSGE